jgi:CHAD domain-containing protein
VVDNARSRALIQKLDRSLAKADEKLAPERVHLIRTTSRRLEALLETLGDKSDRKQRKLQKRLKLLRRGAGAVRDVDVQIAALRSLKIGREQERKARLMQALTEQRGEREQELAKTLADKDVQKVQKALRRWSDEIGSAEPAVPQDSTGKRDYNDVAATLRMFATLARRVRSLTPDNLHAYRTRCKRMRYVAEMEGSRPETRRVVEPLKRIQDAVGDWHDWLTLTQTAESLFSRPLESGLVAALRNVSNAKFVEARRVCQEERRGLMAQYRAMLAEKRRQRALVPAIPSKAVAAAAGVARTKVA